MSNEFLNGLQAASNAVAGNVAGPVDILAFLLRKAGMPVPENAIGGSNWMTQKGLMAPVRQGASQVIGETAGLLGPAMVSQFGPQIARGLLKGGENLAAPRTLNPQTGAVVYHGSPHKFDKFDSSKIGTGEGAQAYGHGLYLADSPDVAGTYAVINAKSAPKPQTLQRLRDAAPVGSAEWKHYDALLNEGTSHLYKVDLPDEKIARMLDWDKPLSEQAPMIQQRIYDSMIDAGFDKPLVNHILNNKTGAELLNELGGRLAVRNPSPLSGSAQASEFVKKAGIPGIRYLDGGSRGAGQGTRNYVVFPGEESSLRILERNGQGLLGP